MQKTRFFYFEDYYFSWLYKICACFSYIKANNRRRKLYSLITIVILDKIFSPNADGYSKAVMGTYNNQAIASLMAVSFHLFYE